MKLSLVFDLLPERIAYAHCDIPCGIYDPHNAQMAAHTIIRMTQMLENLKREDETKAEHDIVRITHVKEEHSSILEAELMTLKNDYFKEEVVAKYPEVSDLFANALKMGAKARVGIDMESAKELLEITMKIAEVFYQSKGLESARVKAPYPTGLDIVVQR
jgi:nickel superoxide dismutase